MIHENNLAKRFWAEAVNTTCYVQNRIYIRPMLNKTTYEIFKGRKPNISYFHKFGCTCYILNNKVYLKKFDAKAQKGIFLGYSERSKDTDCIIQKHTVLKNLCMSNLITKSLEVKRNSRMKVLQVQKILMITQNLI